MAPAVRALVRQGLRISALLTAVASGIVFVACGGDDDEQDATAGSDKAQIRFALSEWATSSDPEKCTQFSTQKGLEQGSGLQGEPAIRACEALAGIGNAESVKVSSVDVRGATATAVVKVTGSDLDGQSVQVKLVKDDRRWKFDRLLAFKSFDRAAMNAAMEDLFRELGTPAPARECIVSQFEELTDEAVRSMYINPPGALKQIGEDCAPPLQ